MYNLFKRTYSWIYVSEFRHEYDSAAAICRCVSTLKKILEKRAWWSTLQIWSFSAICDALCDLVPFVELKKRENHPWSSVTFSKVADF